MSNLVEAFHQLSLLITAVGGILAAWGTYHLSKTKSDREGWRGLYFEMKGRAESAEEKVERLQHENEKLKTEIETMKIKENDK